MPSSGDELTIVSWEGFRSRGPLYLDQTLDFQVKLFAGGHVEIHYGRQTPLMRGGQATSWFEDPTGATALAINVRSTSPGIEGNSGWRFEYSP